MSDDVRTMMIPSGGPVGGVDDDPTILIKINARHRDIATAENYHEDAQVLKGEINGNPILAGLQQIYPFEDSLLYNSGTNLHRLNQFDQSHETLDSLPAAAEYFVTGNQITFPFLKSFPNGKENSLASKMPFDFVGATG